MIKRKTKDENTPGKWHKDTNNVGVTRLISLGNFEGGKTEVKFDDDHIVELDSKLQWITLLAKESVHRRGPSFGERYVITYYTNKLPKIYKYGTNARQWSHFTSRDIAALAGLVDGITINDLFSMSADTNFLNSLCAVWPLKTIN